MPLSKLKSYGFFPVHRLSGNPEVFEMSSVRVTDEFAPPQFGMMHSGFEALVHKIIETVEKEKLTEMRRDFHTRLRITLTQPDNAELIEDLWDFFYDWSVFDQQLPETVDSLSETERESWHRVKGGSQRSLYAVSRSSADGLKLKDLYTGKSYVVPKKAPSDYLGIARGDIVEARLICRGPDPKKGFAFVRRPSYHPAEVHGYIKKKVKQFRKAQDYESYQTWLWLVVGMYLKHRIYHQMPIDKIYDDNSRI